MGDTCTDQVLDLATIRLLQQAITANVKWLEVVGGIYRHTERDDVIFLAVDLKWGKMMALVAVEDQQPAPSLCIRCRMVVEMLNLI